MSVKRHFRHVATTTEWQRLRDEKLGLCRSCGAWPVSLHHVVSRSLGGDDVAENLIPLCGDGTRGCHGAIENHTRHWRAVAANIRESLTNDELEYATQTKSLVWLDRYYPERLAA